MTSIIVILPDSICDHSRSYEFYAESISGLNKFKAKKCRSYLYHCSEKDYAFMGGYPGNLDKSVSGIFKLYTRSHSPYSKS